MKQAEIFAKSPLKERITIACDKCHMLRIKSLAKEHGLSQSAVVERLLTVAFNCIDKEDKQAVGDEE